MQFLKKMVSKNNLGNARQPKPPPPPLLHLKLAVVVLCIMLMHTTVIENG